MYTISVGGMELKHWTKYPSFLSIALKTLRLAKVTDGCIHAEIFKKQGVYFTLSVWESPRQMKSYAATGFHKTAMARASETTKSARNHNYQGETVPSKNEAFERWSNSAT